MWSVTLRGCIGHKALCKVECSLHGVQEMSEDEFEDGYGSDLMGDEEDRAKLMAMTELEREMILADRAEAARQGARAPAQRAPRQAGPAGLPEGA